MRQLKIFLVGFLLAVSSACNAWAQISPTTKPNTSFESYPPFYSSYCANAVQNSDLVKCLSEHLTHVQDQLNNAFADAVEGLDEQAQNTLRMSQKNWISYRDSVCAWESRLNPQRSEEAILSKACDLRLTQRRLEDLRVLTKPSYKRREFALQPRWFSLLAKNHPDLWWDLSSTLSKDTDCDGVEEILILGLNIQDPAQNILAVLKTAPQTAPKADLIELSALCAQGYTVSVENSHVHGEDAALCTPPDIVLTGESESCQSFRLRYNEEIKNYSSKEEI